MAKEHELVSLGGQAAAAAHSLGTPLSTIKIISSELSNQIKDNSDLSEDVKLLESQVDRCNKILKKLTLNPSIEDDFIGNDISLKEYISQIVKSYEEISEKVITEGLVNIGLLKGDPEELHKSGAYKDFYMHKIGHWLGLDVHDAGDYTEGDEFMTFKPGMITTIEPGIYISSKMDVDDKWKGIGVRIEDDILVTKDGNENLTKKVPSDPNEIESLMS